MKAGFDVAAPSFFYQPLSPSFEYCVAKSLILAHSFLSARFDELLFVYWEYRTGLVTM